MAEGQAVEPEELSTPERPWSHAVLAGGRPLHVSGQTSVGPDGTVRHRGDLRAQFEAALGNLATVLDAAGGTTADLAALTVYVTDMAAWREGDVGDVRYDFLEAPYPASTLVEVSGLARPDLLVEVEGVAYLDSRGSGGDAARSETP